MGALPRVMLLRGLTVYSKAVNDTVTIEFINVIQNVIDNYVQVVKGNSPISAYIVSDVLKGSIHITVS